MSNRNCPDCGNDMIRRKGQQIENVDIVRFYCEPCKKVISTFEITTEEPLEDAQALLEQ